MNGKYRKSLAEIAESTEIKVLGIIIRIDVVF